MPYWLQVLLDPDTGVVIPTPDHAMALCELVIGKLTGLRMCVRVVVMGPWHLVGSIFHGGALLSFTSKIHCERASDEHVK